MNQKVYHVDVQSQGQIVRLYFPSAQTRKLFCLMKPEIVYHCGKRPLMATKSDLARTRMNISHYHELKNFLVIWDTFMQ